MRCSTKAHDCAGKVLLAVLVSCCSALAYTCVVAVSIKVLYTRDTTRLLPSCCLPCLRSGSCYSLPVRALAKQLDVCAGSRARDCGVLCADNRAGTGPFLAGRHHVPQQSYGKPTRDSMLLRIKLVNSLTDCEPLVDAFVDVWSCNSMASILVLQVSLRQASSRLLCWRFCHATMSRDLC